MGAEDFPGTIRNAEVLMVGGGGRWRVTRGRVHKWTILAF
jgi:hypothetical protein